MDIITYLRKDLPFRILLETGLAVILAAGCHKEESIEARIGELSEKVLSYKVVHRDAKVIEKYHEYQKNKLVYLPLWTPMFLQIHPELYCVGFSTSPPLGTCTDRKLYDRFEVGDAADVEYAIIEKTFFRVDEKGKEQEVYGRTGTYELIGAQPIDKKNNF